jgi:peptidylprolyl isomerase
MRNLIAGGLLATLFTGPALASGLEIVVAGEANGTITVDLLEDVAPQHVARITELAAAGKYDGVVFHRVIEGFMAQTGDVEHGLMGSDMHRAGTGGSDLPDLPAEFSTVPFEKGVVGMARSQSPDSANSQFFIMFDAAPFLDGQYTVVGRVTGGQDVVDAIKRGEGANGAVTGQPDVMQTVTVTE